MNSFQQAALHCWES